jgi:hypothetical protein
MMPERDISTCLPICENLYNVSLHCVLHISVSEGLRDFAKYAQRRRSFVDCQNIMIKENLHGLRKSIQQTHRTALSDTLLKPISKLSTNHRYPHPARKHGLLLARHVRAQLNSAVSVG